MGLRQNLIEELDVRALLSKIDRDRAETQKLAAETDRLLAQARATRWLTLFVIVGAVCAGIAYRLPEILAHL